MRMRDRAVFAHPRIRFLLYGLTAAPHDRARHARAVLQVRVGRIDDRVRGLCGDVALHDLEVWPVAACAQQTRFMHDFIPKR